MIFICVYLRLSVAYMLFTFAYSVVDIFFISTVAEKSCLIHTERPLNYVRGDREDASTALSMTLFLRVLCVLRGEFVFSTVASRIGEILFDTHTERPLNCVRGDRRDVFIWSHNIYLCISVFICGLYAFYLCVLCG